MKGEDVSGGALNGVPYAILNVQRPLTSKEAKQKVTS